MGTNLIRDLLKRWVEQGSIYGRRDHCHSEYDQKHSEPEISKIL